MGIDPYYGRLGSTYFMTLNLELNNYKVAKVNVLETSTTNRGSLVTFFTSIRSI